MKPKVGDIVTLKPAIVRAVSTNQWGEWIVNLDFEDVGAGCNWTIRAAAIASIEPRPLQVGDRVQWKDRILSFVGTYTGNSLEHELKRCGTIRDIQGTTCAIWDGDEYYQKKLSDLTRIGDA